MNPTMTHSSNRIRLGTVLTAGVLTLSACADAFFHDPATSLAIPVEVRTSLATTAAAGGAPGEAFDKTDQAHVVLSVGDHVLHDEVITFPPGSGEKRVAFELEIEAAATAQILVAMRALGDLVFSGSTSLSLTPGQAASANVPLSPVEVAIAVEGAPPSVRVGRNVALTANSLFATGDAVGTVAAQWEALSLNISVSPNGVVSTLGEGLAELRATYQGLTALASFDVIDPCVLGPQPILFGTPVEGTLSRDEDCLTDTGTNRLFDEYRFTAPSGTPFTVTMSSQGFGPFFPTFDDGGQQRSGHGTNDASSLTREYVLPGGSWSVKASSVEMGTGLDDAAEGSYTLVLQPQGGPVQDGCIGTTGVYFGVSASGSLQGNDCLDEFNPDPQITRRWDGFSILLLAGQTGNVEVVADFPLLLAQWVGGSFNEALNNVPPGEPAVFSGAAEVSDFFAWYVVNENDGDTGNYTIRFNSGLTTLAPNLVVARGSIPGSAAENSIIQVSADIQNVAGPLGPVTIVADVYIAVQPDLSGPHVLLGQLIQSGPLDNGELAGAIQNFTLPSGISGPHYVLVVLDPSNAIAESGENNLFSLGLMDIN